LFQEFPFREIYDEEGWNRVEAGAESVSERFSLLDLVEEYIEWKEKEEERLREKYKRSKIISN
jgi:hypothetical protein